jgi:hypothetical protein
MLASIMTNTDMMCGQAGRETGGTNLLWPGPVESRVVLT